MRPLAGTIFGVVLFLFIPAVLYLFVAHPAPVGASVAAGLLLLHRPDAVAIAAAAWLFAAGVVLFSGSLYLLALTGVRGLGAVTPFGGVAFLAGWAAFAWGAWRTLEG